MATLIRRKGQATAIVSPVGAPLQAQTPEIHKVVANPGKNHLLGEAERVYRKTDAKGKVVTYAYDGNRNLLSETVDDAATPAVTYGYDNLDRRVSVQGICCNWIYEYDSLDQLIQESWAKPDPSHQLIGTNVYGYDRIGNRTAMQWIKPGGEAAEGRAFSYTFDAVNRLTSLAETGGPGQAQYTYDDVGNLTRMVYPNGIETRYTYDRLGRITELENRTAGAVVLSRFVYAYDWASRRTRIDMTRKVPAQPQTVVESVDYGYDLMSRLTSETRKSALGTVIYSYAWTYDGVGNRTGEVYTDDADQVTWKTYTYDAADRLVLEEKQGPGPAFSTTSYLWDQNGNLIKKTDSSGMTMYAWDYRDRLVGATLPDGKTVEFGYCDGCALGKRMSKIVRAPVTAGGQILSQKNYVWDGQNIIGELDQNDNVIADYTVMPLSLMDNVISMRRGANVYYYLYDAMGTVWQVVNASGAVVNSYDYDAWGVQRGSVEDVINPFRWQTKPWDDEIGMYYSRARYYDATVGIFTTIDPFSRATYRPQERYSWPYFSPTLVADPTGQDACKDWLRDLKCEGEPPIEIILNNCLMCCAIQRDKAKHAQDTPLKYDMDKAYDTAAAKCRLSDGRNGPEHFDKYMGKHPEWNIGPKMPTPKPPSKPWWHFW